MAANFIARRGAVWQRKSLLPWQTQCHESTMATTTTHLLTKLFAFLSGSLGRREQRRDAGRSSKRSRLASWKTSHDVSCCFRNLPRISSHVYLLQDSFSPTSLSPRNHCGYSLIVATGETDWPTTITMAIAFWLKIQVRPNPLYVCRKISRLSLPFEDV